MITSRHSSLLLFLLFLSIAMECLVSLRLQKAVNQVSMSTITTSINIRGGGGSGPPSQFPPTSDTSDNGKPDQHSVGVRSKTLQDMPKTLPFFPHS